MAELHKSEFALSDQPSVQLGKNQAASFHGVAYWHVVTSPTRGFCHAVPPLDAMSVLPMPM
jgi:hypothetical protein